MSSRREKVIGYGAALFAGVAGAEVFRYTVIHHTVHLIIAAIAALVVVLIIGTTAVVTRCSGKPPESPV